MSMEDLACKNDCDFEWNSWSFKLITISRVCSVNHHTKSERNQSVSGATTAQLVVCWARCPAWCSIAGLIFFWASGRRDFLELIWVLTPFPQISFGWGYKLRSSPCTRAFHCTDSKQPDVYVLDGWMPTTKTYPACTIHEDRMWLPHWTKKTVTYTKISPIAQTQKNQMFMS